MPCLLERPADAIRHSRVAVPFIFEGARRDSLDVVAVSLECDRLALQVLRDPEQRHV